MPLFPPSFFLFPYISPFGISTFVKSADLVFAFLPVFSPIRVHCRDKHHGRTTCDGGIIADTERASKCNDHGDHFQSCLRASRHQLCHVPVEVLELALPYVQTELTGDHQATDLRAMPLAEYVTEVMLLLESGDCLRGEVLVERDRARRWAERDGCYLIVLVAGVDHAAL